MDCLLAGDTGFALLAKFSWFDPNSWWAITQVVLGLGFVIFIHELGHFLVAKACGVKCEKFYVGFDAFDVKIGDTVLIPRSLVKWQWGETEYGIGVIPLGGYVKMLGQDDNPSNLEAEIARSMGEDATPEDLQNGLLDRSKLDPRSFLAKNVPQRMAIISAGVIFNIIFAVIMAAWAFHSGVNYDLPVVGNVLPGSPAWKQGEFNGASIVRVNDKKFEDYLPYIDLVQEVALNEKDKPVEFEYRPAGADPDSTETKVIEITPSTAVDPESGIARIGVSPGSTNVIASENALMKGFSASRAVPELKGGDRIVAVDNLVVFDGYTLRQALTAKAGHEVVLKIEREIESDDPDAEPEIETFETLVLPNARRELGFYVGWQKVFEVQDGSPAFDAGIRAGDIIKMIDGKPRGNLLTLDYRMTDAIRDEEKTEIPVQLLRGEETIEVTVRPRMPRVIPASRGMAPVAIDSFGMAVGVTDIVEDVIPGSPAETAGIQAGDKLQKFEFLLSDEQKVDPIYSGMVDKPVYSLVEDEVPWTILDAEVQGMPVGSRFGVTVMRDKKEISTELETVSAYNAWLVTRGFRLTPARGFYRSDDLGSAISLGARQAWKDGTRVLKTLRKIMTGEISATNLGGPGTIAVVATSEASEGTSRLLLFLTMLSANLAIINFLPIPVLDGGHMMFLAYEGIFRRPVTPQVQNVLTIVGLFLILALMAFVLLLDVTRLSGWF